MTKEISSIPGMIENSKEAVTQDFREIIGKADHLLKGATHSVTEELSATRHAISEMAGNAANATHQYVHSNPWRIVGIAALAGVLVGALISRR